MRRNTKYKIWLILAGISFLLLLIGKDILEEYEIEDIPQVETYMLKNAWIMEVSEDRIQVLAGKTIKEYFCENADVSMREQIADITIQEDEVKQIQLKKDKINGKVLRVQENSIELEGKGTYTTDDEIKVYRLCKNIEEVSLKDLSVGYNFTDFVVENNRIVACLIVREAVMDNIRVLLKNTDYISNYHEQVTFYVDSEYEVIQGEKTTLKKAYEETVLAKEDGNAEERILIRPVALTGKIYVTSIQRTQGTPVYRGNLEITKMGQGYVLVNELPLEEYLYAVVPSEMPASYPIEALKAQAICARTYAYRNMKQAGMAAFGAHVDDSTAYQVYNNILENSATTKAVTETMGQLLYCGEELIEAYYYSTSCGYGANSSVWNGSNPEDYPYLEARRISRSGNRDEFTSISEEKKFTEHIQKAHPEDYEWEEPWYRWTVTVDNLDSEVVLERMKERYQAAPECILTKVKKNEYVSKEISEIGKITAITVEERGEGGNIETLKIEGTKHSFFVKKEYNIRYILSDRASLVTKQNGDTVPLGTLLPSAYFSIESIMDGRQVEGYSILGGGYGHGVGMSQNAAKVMALQGTTSEEILAFFYNETTVQTIY